MPVCVIKNLSVGYAYDLGISKTKSYTGSSSEFLLGFTFGGGKKDPMDDVARKEEPKDSLTDAMIAKIES